MTTAEKPKPKFKFNDSARMHLWRIMTMSSEITDRKAERACVLFLYLCNDALSFTD
jgi:hypothetical protein